jgi:PAS domain S-box-containing protein
MDNLNRIVAGSKEWMERILGEDSTAGERMFSSESYFDAFWDAVGHGVAIVSEDGTVIDANPAFCALLDINYEQAIGLNIRKFVADGQWREDMRTIETMALGRQGEIVTEERWNKNLNPNGPFIPVRVRAMRIPTGQLNSLISDATMMKQPPSDKGRRLKIYYVTQVGVKPPLFSFQINDRELMHFSYARYLENKIREGYGFTGTSLKFVFREKGEKVD